MRTKRTEALQAILQPLKAISDELLDKAASKESFAGSPVSREDIERMGVAIERAMHAIFELPPAPPPLESSGTGVPPIVRALRLGLKKAEAEARQLRGAAERAMLALTDVILERGPSCPRSVINVRNELLDALDETSAAEPAPLSADEAKAVLRDVEMDPGAPPPARLMDFVGNFERKEKARPEPSLIQEALSVGEWRSLMRPSTQSEAVESRPHPKMPEACQRCDYVLSDWHHSITCDGEPTSPVPGYPMLCERCRAPFGAHPGRHRILCRGKAVPVKGGSNG